MYRTRAIITRCKILTIHNKDINGQKWGKKYTYVIQAYNGARTVIPFKTSFILILLFIPLYFFDVFQDFAFLSVIFYNYCLILTIKYLSSKYKKFGTKFKNSN